MGENLGIQRMAGEGFSLNKPQRLFPAQDFQWVKKKSCQTK